MRLSSKIVLPFTLFTGILAALYALFFISLQNIRSQIVSANQNVQEIVALTQELSALQLDTIYNMTLYKMEQIDESLSNIDKNRNSAYPIIEAIEAKISSAQEAELLAIYKSNSDRLQKKGEIAD